jgi:hypothetical protein
VERAWRAVWLSRGRFRAPIIRQCLPPRVSDPQRGDVELVGAGHDAVGRRSDNAGAAELDQLLDGEAVREQQRLAAAFLPALGE